MPKSLPRLLVPFRSAGLILLCSAALAGTVLSAEDQAPSLEGVSEVLELKDETLIARLWEILHPDSTPPPGEYQILLPPSRTVAMTGGEGDAGAYLLRNGTAEGRMDRGAWEQAAAFSRQEKVVRWKDDWEEPESEYIPTVWQSIGRADMEQLIRWTEWPAGFRFQMGSSMSSVPGAKPQFERQMDFEWTQKLYRHFLLGASIRRTEFGGGLVRTARSAAVVDDPDTEEDEGKIDFWTDPYWWWTLSVGAPAVQYTMALANRPVPDLFWLETKSASLIKDRRAGKVVNQWTDSSSLALYGNVAHFLDFRLSSLRYRLQWDGDAYSGLVQTLELEDLPSFFGQWGVGIITTRGVAATRAWLDIPDFAFSLARPTAYPSRFRFAFLRLDMAYRNLKSYQLGVSLTVRVENPIMNLPGASR